MERSKRLMIVPYGNSIKLCDRFTGQYWLEGRLSMQATLEDNRKLENRLKGAYEDYISAIANRSNGNY